MATIVKVLSFALQNKLRTWFKSGLGKWIFYINCFCWISRGNNRDVNTISPGAHLSHSSIKKKQTKKKIKQIKNKQT